MKKAQYVLAIAHAMRRADKTDRQVFLWLDDDGRTYKTAFAEDANIPRAEHVATVDSETIIWEVSRRRQPLAGDIYDDRHQEVK